MENQDIESVVDRLAVVLDRLIEANEKNGSSGAVTKFQSSYAPDVTVLSYLERINKYARVSDAVFVAALVYIDRLISHQNLVLSMLNVHRVLITSVLLAAKFLEDVCYNNAFYARLGGVSGVELNSLELEFLHGIGFTLHISDDLFDRYKHELLQYNSPAACSSDSHSPVTVTAALSGPGTPVAGPAGPSPYGIISRGRAVATQQAASLSTVGVVGVGCPEMAPPCRPAAGVYFHPVAPPVPVAPAPRMFPMPVYYFPPRSNEGYAPPHPELMVSSQHQQQQQQQYHQLQLLQRQQHHLLHHNLTVPHLVPGGLCYVPVSPFDGMLQAQLACSGSGPVHVVSLPSTPLYPHYGALEACCSDGSVHHEKDWLVGHWGAAGF